MGRPLRPDACLTVMSYKEQPEIVVRKGKQRAFCAFVFMSCLNVSVFVFQTRRFLYGGNTEGHVQFCTSGVLGYTE